MSAVIQAIKESGFDVTWVVCGYDVTTDFPAGVDKNVHEWVTGREMPVTYFTSFDFMGRLNLAGRNDKMVRYAAATSKREGGAAVLVIWDGRSDETSLADVAKREGVPVKVFRYTEEEQ